MDEATKRFIKEHRNEDPRALALQAARYAGVNMREAVTQIEGWQKAKNKLPEWAATDGIIFPPRISMEQCSSEITARYKASLVTGKNLTDLTGGFGIDCSYMARSFEKATYIERNEHLCDTARHNFALLGLKHIDIINGNSEEFIHNLPKQDLIFADPARRDEDGHKVVALSDCQPNVAVLEPLLLRKSDKVMIKCSPMLDIAAAEKELKHISGIHIIAVNNECKELLFILSPETNNSRVTHCINFTGNGEERFSFIREEESKVACLADSVGEYLYEPNVTIQKAGCHHSLANATGTKKLHPNTQLFTADRMIENFPGRRFKVADIIGFSKNEIKRITQLGKANITVRNFPDSVQTLRKRLKLEDGGDDYIFATTLADGRRVLILCRKA